MLEKKHSNVITVYFHSKLVICIEREKSGYKTIKRTAELDQDFLLILKKLSFELEEREEDTDHC
jgi:hypothetical protein